MKAALADLRALLAELESAEAHAERLAAALDMFLTGAPSHDASAALAAWKERGK